MGPTTNPKSKGVPNHKWAHLSQYWPPISSVPKMVKRTPGPKLAKNHSLAIFHPLTSGNDQMLPAQFQKVFPSIQGKDSLSPMYSIPRIQAWYIYGIIYHYAAILPRNPMVIFSGPKYQIPIQVSKSLTHFKGSHFSHSALRSLAATRRPFKDPNHLALQELGCIFFSGLFQGQFQEGIKH
ncbi:hypothetical protein O181_088155 [Austropuccinia psidii MF-1]|uniref:Uncharacterized protein n=1 Tax=Austropuccinia psidii MF-1 TaxID=1389203 RepID=A0A9Q3IR98_9BASI|nr:hypothetical protein [Austropuccinia psidii MF-1]